MSLGFTNVINHLKYKLNIITFIYFNTLIFYTFFFILIHILSISMYKYKYVIALLLNISIILNDHVISGNKNYFSFKILLFVSYNNRAIY